MKLILYTSWITHRDSGLQCFICHSTKTLQQPTHSCLASCNSYLAASFGCLFWLCLTRSQSQLSPFESPCLCLLLEHCCGRVLLHRCICRIQTYPLVLASWCNVWMLAAIYTLQVLCDIYQLRSRWSPRDLGAWLQSLAFANYKLPVCRASAWCWHAVAPFPTWCHVLFTVSQCLIQDPMWPISSWLHAALPCERWDWQWW